MSYIFLCVPKIITGVGCLESLKDEAPRLGRSGLLVTGRTAMKKAGITERVTRLLQQAGLSVTLFDQVEAEPDVTTIDRGRELASHSSAEVVIGLGGGSALDAAKAIAGLADEQASTEAFHGETKPAGTGIPFLAIPTTSGTGAEVTPNAVITNRARLVKKSIRHDSFLAKLVILDPELTLPLPPALTAYTGMDALTQAIESFTSIHATPITDGLAFEAARLILGGLPRAFEDGSDIEAREKMAYGSLLAGIALANARLGAVHGLAHPLGVRYRIPHGLVCAILLPAVMKFNREAAQAKYARLSELVGEDIIEHMEKLLRLLKIPSSFRDYRIPELDFPEIVAESMPSGSLKANPRKLTQADLYHILKQVC